jgi:hypothetical protein
MEWPRCGRLRSIVTIHVYRQQQPGIRRRKGNARQHIHVPTGTTLGELAARSLSLYARMCLPFITGVLVLEPDHLFFLVLIAICPLCLGHGAFNKTAIQTAGFGLSCWLFGNSNWQLSPPRPQAPGRPQAQCGAHTNSAQLGVNHYYGKKQRSGMCQLTVQVMSNSRDWPRAERFVVVSIALFHGAGHAARRALFSSVRTARRL